MYIDTFEQATRKAQQARYKAVKQEHSTAQALTNAQHKHDLAVADEHKAANDLSVRIVRAVTLAQPVLTICTPSRVVSLGFFRTADVPEVPSGGQSSYQESAY